MEHENAQLGDRPNYRRTSPRPPWSPGEAATVRRRLAAACSSLKNRSRLGPGSCVGTCTEFLNSPIPSKSARNDTLGKIDSSFCPSWAGLLRYLVQCGQFDVVGGGWVSHDEALSSPYSVVNQLTLGRRTLLGLGLSGPGAECSTGSDDGQTSMSPATVSWQVDPFGHSASTAKIFQDLGYRGHFMNRLHWWTKTSMRWRKALEWVSSGSGTSPSFISVVLDEHYSAPSGLDFEVGDMFPMRSQHPRGSSVDRATSLVSAAVTKRSRNHATPLQLLPMGDDFRFGSGEAAHRHFSHLDAVIKRFASDLQGVAHVEYSSPTRYVAELARYRGVLPQREHSDFLPYSNAIGNEWTGFYGSRPTLKKMVRQLEQKLLAAETAFSLALLYRDNIDDHNSTIFYSSLFQRLQLGRETAALLLHHDAITGTCTVAAARDYISRGRDALR